MFRMCVVLLFFSSICTVVVGAPVTVTGHTGGRADIRCTYESGYESNPKYLCKGACKIGNRNIMVKSGSPAKDRRFSLSDNTTARVFTVTITDLRPADAGQYWCGVERTVIDDVYSEILVLVKQDNKTTEVSTTSPFTATPSNFSKTEPYPQSSSITITERKETIPDRHNSSSGSVIYISVGVVIMLVIFLMALMLLCMKRSRKSPRVTQSGLSQQVSVVLLPLNENTAEDFNDHKYEEINKWQHKNKDITTVYTTADRLDDPTIYSTADKPDDPTIYSTADKPDDSTIYSTADKPDNSTIYSTADRLDDPTIYSTADKPDDPTVYSTADKPDDSTIYSTADKPDDPMIYSTAD
uniref:Immunoglobulin domain-containing protein n=1 Tax=Cyprinus carpio TaxID=7962 RepID=A0A8C1Y7Q9_CYPCA